MPDYKVDFIFGLAVNGVLVFTSIFNMVYGNKLSYVVRIAVSFLVISALMIILPLVTNSLDETAAFWTDIFILFIFGICGGFAQSSVYGLAAMLPSQHMGGVMFGQGIAGIAINACRALCLLVLPPVGDTKEE